MLEGVGSKVMSALGCSPKPWAVISFQLITPTQLGWFVDSTPLGGAGAREGVQGEGGAPGPAERRPLLMGRRRDGILRGVCVVFPGVQEYEKALKYVRGLLQQTEPQNNQAKELERLIDKAMKKGQAVLSAPLPPSTPCPHVSLGPQHPWAPPLS